MIFCPRSCPSCPILATRILRSATLVLGESAGHCDHALVASSPEPRLGEIDAGNGASSRQRAGRTLSRARARFRRPWPSPAPLRPRVARGWPGLAAPLVSAANAASAAASSRSARRRLSFSTWRARTAAASTLSTLRSRSIVGVNIDADNRLAPGVDARLCAGRRLFDAALGQPALDRPRHPAEALDLIDVRLRPRGQVSGERST